MNFRLTGRLGALASLVGGLICGAPVVAPASDAAADGPATYTLACAIREPTDIHPVRHCAELGAAQRCGHEADFSSRASHEAAAMTIVNRSDQPVKVYWLSFSGVRRLYHTVPPGDHVTQPTFIGHNWLVTAPDGHCVGIFNAAPMSLAFF